MRTVGLATAVAVLAIFFLVGGAAGAVSRQRIEGVAISLTIEKPRYTTREEMKITLTVSNRTRATVSYQFPSSQWYDVQIISGKQVVWSWSHGKVYTQAFTTLALEPGTSRTFPLIWNLRGNNGSPVAPGNYALVAIFPITSGGLPGRSNPLRLTFYIVE